MFLNARKYLLNSRRYSSSQRGLISPKLLSVKNFWSKIYKIYPTFCCETSKTQYVHCAAYINTIYGDSLVRLSLFRREGTKEIMVIWFFTSSSSFKGEIKQIFFTTKSVCLIKPGITSLVWTNGFFFENEWTRKKPNSSRFRCYVLY